jgi:hypothetical protein
LFSFIFFFFFNDKATTEIYTMLQREVARDLQHAVGLPDARGKAEEDAKLPAAGARLRRLHAAK